jgi:hypothetical protein
MLYTKAKPPAKELKPIFAEREAWKSTRRYQ